VLKYSTADFSKYKDIIFSNNRIIISSYFSSRIKNRFASILAGSLFLADLLPASTAAVGDFRLVRILTSKLYLKRSYITREPLASNNIHNLCDRGSAADPRHH
jgi:hypothetical protein